MKRYILTIIAFVVVSSVWGYQKHIYDSLAVELGKARTIEDSLKLSLDLFDAAPRSQQPMRARAALKLAERTGDMDIQLDMVRNIVNISTAGNDTIFDEFLEYTANLPESEDRKITRLFIRIKQNTRAARTMTAEESHEKINDLMNKIESSNGASVRTKLEALFTLCAYLEQIYATDIMVQQLDKIGELLDAMPEKSDALESIYYTQSSLTSTACNAFDRAVEADNKLLKLVDKMQQKYIEKGRRFHDFDYNRYVIYRRMLSNYPALTPEEVEYYYSEVKRLSTSDPIALRDFKEYRRPDIYYHMSRKEYDKALPILVTEVTRNNASMLPYVRRLLLNMVVEAAEATGKKDALLMALLELRKMDDSELTRQSAEQYHKLQFIYNRSNQQLAVAKAELEKRDAVLASHRIIVILGVISLVFLLGLAGVLTYHWRRSKRLNKDLEQTNVKLVDERDTLRRIQSDLIRAGEVARTAEKQKEEFIDNMSHEVSTPLSAIVEYSQLIVDCVDDGKNPYLTRFANVVKLNSDLLTMLFNDMLELSTADNQGLKVERKPMTVGRVAAIAIDSIKNRVKPGVELVNNINLDDNLLLNIDTRRVTQVLLNLLANAAKFTTQGSITLDGQLVDDGRQYRFAVTDTGIGVPAGKEEIIFERFEKLNRYSQGIGLGLPVCRIIASLLGGEVVVDTTHEGEGSRFIFTVPIKED